VKGLATLIKLRQRELDKLRQNLSKMEDELQKLIMEDKRLAKELEDEMALASQHPEMAGFFGGFAEGIEHKQKQLRALANEVNKAIAKLQSDITDAFGELKRLEITRDRLKAEQDALIAKREQHMLDDLGIQQFVRRESAEDTAEQDSKETAG
jgi:flagellar FliJ protein